ncbi:MAG TPA: DUF1223 domain-containing protein [Bryobacteraceae bacterium]|nr:DUF1223 domain-containing protein [Bryobacteraceae bacterium]
MKYFLAAIAFVLPIGLCYAASPGRTPVVVELFTSEGCSSCPPADALLSKLDRDQPVAGARIIALEEHVDYWDHQGWRDPFSSSLITARQQQFGAALHVDNIYTPEMVIDGRREFVGNDSQRAFDEISKAAGESMMPIQLAVKDLSAGRAVIAVNMTAPGRPAELLLAVTETGLASDVQAGENAGRSLKHSAVVRRLSVIGKLKPGEPFSAQPVIKLSKAWKPENIRAVVLAADRTTGQILGAEEIALSR